LRFTCFKGGWKTYWEVDKDKYDETKYSRNVDKIEKYLLIIKKDDKLKFENTWVIKWRQNIRERSRNTR
jgi:hypothetical protein